MCGRFGSSFTGKELADRFDISENPPLLKPSFNIAPGFTIPAIIRNSPSKVVMMRWGFIPEWANPSKIKIKPINARDDQVFVSGFYKAAISNTRCIIPFSFFYEWKRFTLEGKEQKQPYCIKVKNENIMGFAGIFSEKKDAEGLPVYTCAIITTKPNALMAKIHNRMPVILHKNDEDKWLNKECDLKAIKGLLNSYNEKDMEAWRVSTNVNSPRNDSPDLLQPL